MTLRTGITTGACAAAAAKAAALVLTGQAAPDQVELTLPAGDLLTVPIVYARRMGESSAEAAVKKDAGDDLDVTDGLEVRIRLEWSEDDGIQFRAGEGVGTVTKPGLQIPPGQPAINPVPRRMIEQAIRQVSPRGAMVEVAIPGGREVAARTFNPRLGVAGGLSILGTTGIVRPYCTKALHDALGCALNVAAACGVTAPVLVPGNIGAKAARLHFVLRDEQLIEVGNEWGFIVDELAGLKSMPFRALLVLGHPGKLAKLAAGEWDTHSSRSASALAYVNQLAGKVLGNPPTSASTVEGLFADLDVAGRTKFGEALSARVASVVADRLSGATPKRFLLGGVGKEQSKKHGQDVPKGRDAHATHGQDARATPDVAVVLVNMAGEILGQAGELLPWR